MSRIVEKACVYATRARDELLVFERPDADAGVRVPGGTVESDEPHELAALRELKEECGIAGDRATYLGSIRRHHPRRPEIHHRHFFHAPVEERRDRWDHVVTGGGDDAGTVFRCYWLPVPAAPYALDHGFDALVHRLR
ncbi:NUDIX hydrolase [Halomarina pelagica]|uniref:NUDIX hydrolase n=1 Tax=Halomarina pelagica TaxID=2961599 RepID=UPI0020C50C9E|nr:NUDIX domain-containing protein [Halomarina sp. BND7]